MVATATGDIIDGTSCRYVVGVDPSDGPEMPSVIVVSTLNQHGAMTVRIVDDDVAAVEELAKAMLRTCRMVRRNWVAP